ncbi:hypothetical protein BKA62DRAFT_709496 [Auriculariales sp. MPI-PUGE-AT-0066]|nr:hypothetical protein BKA62DRAFT_709496 [Auriculariales sp. MPI-PUGE-AT-0066]
MLFYTILVFQLLSFTFAAVPQPLLNLVAEGTVGNLTNPPPHLAARQTVSDFQITTGDSNSHPTPSNDVKYASVSNCNSDGVSLGDLSQYPIILHIPTGTTFWPLSYEDNRYSLAIVGFSSSGAVVTQFELQGTRYICSIAFADTQSFVLFGQADTSVQVSFSQLLQTGSSSGTVDSPPPSSTSGSSGTVDSPPPSSTPGSGSSSPPVTQAPVVKALQKCADCGNQKCEFKDTQSRGSQDRKTSVGTPVLNCGGSDRDVEQQIAISQDIEETWSLSTTFGASVGFLSKVEFAATAGWEHADTKSFSETIKFVVPPGKMARCVALVTYTLTEGVLWQDGRQVGSVTSNQPSSINGRDIEVVNCGQTFNGEQTTIQPKESCNGVTSRMSLATAGWMLACSAVALVIVA